MKYQHKVMKSAMIITVDLSAPRKFSYNAFNGMLFELKMKDPGLYKYRGTTIMALFSFILRNEASLIVGSGGSLKGFNLFDVGNYIQAYGMQNYYLKLEMLKIRESVLLSANLIKLPSKTSDIKRKQ